MGSLVETMAATPTPNFYIHFFSTPLEWNPPRRPCWLRGELLQNKSGSSGSEPARSVKRPMKLKRRWVLTPISAAHPSCRRASLVVRFSAARRESAQVSLSSASHQPPIKPSQPPLN